VGDKKRKCELEMELEKVMKEVIVKREVGSGNMKKRQKEETEEKN